MGYTEGMAIAEAFVSRHDNSSKQPARCDPRYGWKRGAKGCIRLSPKEDPNKGFGTDVYLTPSDREVFVSKGLSKDIDAFAKQNSMNRGESVTALKDIARTYLDIANTSLERDPKTREIREENVRDHYKYGVKNAYGTYSHLSKREEEFIANIVGGVGKIKGLPLDKEVEYYKDIYHTVVQNSGDKSKIGKGYDDLNRHYSRFIR